VVKEQVQIMSKQKTKDKKTRRQEDKTTRRQDDKKELLQVRRKKETSSERFEGCFWIITKNILLHRSKETMAEASAAPGQLGSNGEETMICSGGGDRQGWPKLKKVFAQKNNQGKDLSSQLIQHSKLHTNFMAGPV